MTDSSTTPSAPACSCGYPSKPCARTQTDCSYIMPRPDLDNTDGGQAPWGWDSPGLDEPTEDNWL